MEWSVLAIEIGLIVGALLILGLGLFWPKHQTRAWTWIGMGLLVFVPIVALVNGWFDPYSTKVFQGLTADSLSFLFKCAFLIAGLMVVLTVDERNCSTFPMAYKPPFDRSSFHVFFLNGIRPYTSPSKRRVGSNLHVRFPCRPRQ